MPTFLLCQRPWLRWLFSVNPKTGARIPEAPIGGIGGMEGTAKDYTGWVAIDFRGSSSDKVSATARSTRNRIYLVGRIETEETIDACQRLLRNVSSLNAAFLCDDSEESLERTLERKHFLDVRALRYQSLDHGETLYVTKSVVLSR